MSQQIVIDVGQLSPLVEKIVTNFMTKGNFAHRAATSNTLLTAKKYNSHKAVGDVLRTLRLSKRLTMDKLSRMIGVSPSYLSRIETGGRRINIDIIQQLCNVYGLTPAELMANVEATPTN